MAKQPVKTTTKKPSTQPVQIKTKNKYKRTSIGKSKNSRPKSKAAMREKKGR